MSWNTYPTNNQGLACWLLADVIAFKLTHFFFNVANWSIIVYSISSLNLQFSILFFFPGFDCPVFDDLFHCMSAVAGGTLTAAEMLNKRECSIAINWQGGWHHAQRYMPHDWNLLEFFNALFLRIDIKIQHKPWNKQQTQKLWKHNFIANIRPTQETSCIGNIAKECVHQQIAITLSIIKSLCQARTKFRTLSKIEDYCLKVPSPSCK